MADRKQQNSPPVFDCHTHLFPPAVFANTARLEGLAAALRLQVDQARARTDKEILKHESRDAGVHACLLLPTAPASGVRKINDTFLRIVEAEDSLFTAGTLHPSDPGVDEELELLAGHGVLALKFSSFSQGFDLQSEETLQLFEKIRKHNSAGKSRFFVILDTFYQADLYFGAPKERVTTPRKLGRLAAGFPEVDFVGAHMGGLSAPYREILEHIVPMPNLYLDTSNAAHVLSRDEFLRLLHLHGPEHILFGTDWPWFGHKEEIPLIGGLLQAAGFSDEERSKVFAGNISRLLNIKESKL